MPDFDTFECDHCGDDFKALASANAATAGYCSPSCHENGENLA